MALSDWVVESGNLVLSGTHTHSGSSAAQAQSNVLSIWEKSKIDSPAYGRIETFFFSPDPNGDSDAGIDLIFRYQDIDNYYRLSWFPYRSYDPSFSKRVNGNETTISQSYLDFELLSGWVGVRATWWGVQGTLYIDMEYNENGSWYRILSNVINDVSPDLQGGGGIGFGHGVGLATLSEPLWIDDTKIYY